VADLTAAVAGLGTLICEGASVGCRAVTRNMAEFTACIAFHGLRLTVAGIVVRSAALVAGGSTRNTACIASPESATESTAVPGMRRNTAAARAVAGNVSRLATRIATGRRAAKSQRRTVGLHMAKTLAVVALLCLSGARQGASVAFVAWLLAVVAKAL